MRKLWLGIVGLAAAATTANAAVIFTMSHNDNGAGALAANNWAVYASVDAASAGLFGFGVDLLPYTQASPAVFLNRANGVVMSDSGTGELMSLGFMTGRTQDGANGKFSGLADLGAGTALKPVYTFGKRADDLDNYIPPNFDTQDSTVGGGRNPYGVETYTPTSGPFAGQARNMFLLGRGTWAAGSPAPTIDVASTDTLASVYLTESGTANARAPLFFDTRNLQPQTGAIFALNGPTEGQNQAVGGAIAVTGANGAYSSEVDQLLANVAEGNAPIQTIGDEAGNVYVMAKLLGDAAAIQSALDGLTTDVGPTDPEFARLHAAYDSQFGAGGFNALFRFPNVAGPKTINFDFGTTGVTVDQLAAVPEPGMISLLGLGALGLVARRRRTA